MIDYLVLEWMTPHPIAVSGLCTVKEARQLMTEQRVRRLLVMDRGHLAGIVTLGDVRAAESQAHDLTVSRIETSSPAGAPKRVAAVADFLCNNEARFFNADAVTRKSADGTAWTFVEGCH